MWRAVAREVPAGGGGATAQPVGVFLGPPPPPTVSGTCGRHGTRRPPGTDPDQQGFVPSTFPVASVLRPCPRPCPPLPLPALSLYLDPSLSQDLALHPPPVSSSRTSSGLPVRRLRTFPQSWTKNHLPRTLQEKGVLPEPRFQEHAVETGRPESLGSTVPGGMPSGCGADRPPCSAASGSAARTPTRTAGWGRGRRKAAPTTGRGPGRGHRAPVHTAGATELGAEVTAEAPGRGGGPPVPQHLSSRRGPKGPLGTVGPSPRPGPDTVTQAEPVTPPPEGSSLFGVLKQQTGSDPHTPPARQPATSAAGSGVDRAGGGCQAPRPGRDRATCAPQGARPLAPPGDRRIRSHPRRSGCTVAGPIPER